MQPSLPQHSCQASCEMHWKRQIKQHIPRAHIAVRLLGLCATMNLGKHVTTKDQTYTCMHSHQQTPLFIVHMLSTGPHSTKEAKGSTEQIRTLGRVPTLLACPLREDQSRCCLLSQPLTLQHGMDATSMTTLSIAQCSTQQGSPNPSPNAPKECISLSLSSSNLQTHVLVCSYTPRCDVPVSPDQPVCSPKCSTPPEMALKRCILPWKARSKHRPAPG